jgi:hypothetical protein
MITLPVSLSTMKDLDSVFFVDLYVMKLISGSLYFNNADVKIPWFIPGTTTLVDYTPVPFERGELKQSVDNRVDNCSIKVSNVTDDFTSALFQSFDFRGSDVDIYQIAYPDSLGVASAYKQAFAGYIDAPSLDMSTGTFEATLKARMPNLETYRTCKGACNAWFGDADECGATQDTKTSTVATGSTQLTIYDAAITEAAGYWKSGVCVIGFESKKIISSAVGSITVEFPFYSVPSVGTSYTIVTGCDKTQTDCKRHSNIKNFSGFPAVIFQYQVIT